MKKQYINEITSAYIMNIGKPSTIEKIGKAVDVVAVAVCYAVPFIALVYFIGSAIFR